MLNRISVGMVVGFVLAAMAAGANADVVNMFTNRQNVNLMNSYAVNVTVGNQGLAGIGPNNLRASRLESSFWDGGNPPGSTNFVTVNFGTTRDVKTIDMGYFPAFSASDYTVETSATGLAGSWTNQTISSYTTSGNSGQLVLAGAADAQYLRITPSTFEDGSDRWVVTSLRAFGDTGALNDTANDIDLVSSTGGPGGGSVTMALNGSVSLTDVANTHDYMDDALYPSQRQVLFNMDAGDGFTLHWSGTKPIDFEKVGLYFAPANFDPNATFTIETSSDDSSYELALTQHGGLSPGLNYFTLSPTDEGEYLRFTYTSTDISGLGAGNFIGDVQVFGELVPEPASAGLLLVGGLLSLRRRRR